MTLDDLRKIAENATPGEWGAVKAHLTGKEQDNELTELDETYC